MHGSLVDNGCNLRLICYTAVMFDSPVYLLEFLLRKKYC